MPTFEIEGRNGEVFEIDSPTDPTPEQLQELFPELLSGETDTVPPPDAGPEPTLEEAEAAREMIREVKNRNATVGQSLRRVMEGALTIGSSAIAEPIAGLAGLGDLAINQDGRQATKTIESVRDFLTVDPLTVQGQIGLEKLAEFPPVAVFIDALTASEEKLGELGAKIGKPGGINAEAGGFAFGSAIPTAVLEGLGLGTVKKLRLGKANLVKNGKPTPELAGALENSGLEFNDLSPEAKAQLGEAAVGASPEELARLARFNEQGIPITSGDLSQDFSQIATEQRLLQAITDEKSEPLRQLKFEQGVAFEKNAQKIIDDLGGSEQAGELLKNALSQRIKLVKGEKNALYKEFAEKAKNQDVEGLDLKVGEIPIIPGTILDAMADKQTFNRIKRQMPVSAQALDDLLVEFGIDRSPAKVARFTKRGEDITPLNVGNFDDFRQAINLLDRSVPQEQAEAMKKLTGPLRKALDAEAGIVDDALVQAGVTDESILGPLRAGRAKVKELKTDFSLNSITGKLSRFQRDGITPVIESSKAFDKLFAPGTAIEQLEKTMDVLKKGIKDGKSPNATKEAIAAGKDSQTAINGLQARVVLKALDKAMEPPTSKFGGKQQFNPNGFVRELDRFGEDKLKLLFADDPKKLKQLNGLRQSARDVTPSADAKVKGSGVINIDAAARFFSTPLIGPAGKIVTDLIKTGLQVGTDQANINKAIAAKPSFSKAAKLIRQDFPNIAAATGVGPAREIGADLRLQLKEDKETK